MEWRFFLNDVEYDEPIGFREIAFRLIRDKDAHGVALEATISELGWRNEARDYLINQKETYGLKADVSLEIQYRCDDGEYDTAYEGKLDFRTYKKRCGRSCIVLIAVEQKGCAMMLKNRMNQKVDLDATTAFDKLTLLPNYEGLSKTISLPGIKLDARVQGYVTTGGITEYIPIPNIPDLLAFGVWARPIYGDERYNSIIQGQLNPASKYSVLEEFEIGVSPQLLLDENTDCYNGDDFNYEFRLKGRFSFDANAEGFAAFLWLHRWNGEGSFSDNAEVIDSIQIAGADDYVSGEVREFDGSFTGAIALERGEGLYATIGLSAFNTDPQEFTITMVWDEETYVNIYNVKQCPPTTADIYLLNETGSRIIEAVTNSCMRLKSDYLGRTDSEPIASAVDGCGSLRAITSGLKIRKAENPVFFQSWDEFIKGIRATDNIGWGLEADEIIPGRQWIRLESADYFYQDVKILDIDHIPQGTEAIDPDRCYSLIKIGYQRWEVERFNGLDEVNSNKEFRTSLTNIDNTLDALSNWVAASIAWEDTRAQQYADTGGADTSYDNETFVICLKRGAPYGYAYPYAYDDISLEVETDNVINAANMFSPTTVYNWRIRPFYNLMRWAKSIFNSYASLFSSDSKIFFSSGTGNLLARGEMIADDCKLENGVKQENQDLSVFDFTNATDYLPIYKAERITFQDYPISVADWQRIKENLYGYFNVQCGNGDFEKYYIENMTYRLAAQKADFDLIKKWV